MKILILQPDLQVGGIEKSLINLINTLKDKYEIDLFLLREEGLFYEQIDKEKIKILSQNIKCNGFFQKIKKYLKLFFFSKKYTKQFSCLDGKEYDVAMVYHGSNFELLKIVKEKVKAKKKIAFLHGDPNFMNKFFLRSALTICDNVVCVSQSCKKECERLFKKFARKVKYLYNPQNVDEIKIKSKEYNLEFNKNVLNILSVARFSKEKGHIRLVKIINKLKNEGITNFKFYFVGNGPLFEKVNKLVNKYNLKDYIELCGNKTNPYPYFKAADLFILMSYNEAAPMVIAESNCLKLPILSTKTISANEMIKNEYFICENSKSGIYKSLKNVILNFNDVYDKFQFNSAYTQNEYKKDLENILKN